jgi:two-component system sensor histidine kinase KdpD
MARLQSGEVKLRKEWQSLEEVIGSAIRCSRRALADRKVTVRLPADLPLVEFDAVLIERVFVNLLENAAKYTPASSTVTINATARDQELLVEVMDDGPGLPPGMEEAIFEKFTRGEAESATPGVGLGLAICRAIISAHHGMIRATNRAGGGAVFSFSLPLGTPPRIETAEQ